MNWEAIGAIGEVAGAAGVIITLAYLAIQIRQNTRAIRLSTVHSISEGLRSLAAIVGGNSSVATLYTTGMLQPEKLNQSERVQFYGLMHNQIRGYEDAFYQQSQNALDSRYWTGLQGQMLSTTSVPGFKMYWQDRREWYSSSFQNHVETFLYPNAKGMILGGTPAEIKVDGT